MKKFLHFLSGGLVFFVAGFFMISSYAGAIVRPEHPDANASVEEENPDNLFSINVANAQYANNNANPTCYDNYQSWTNSTTFKADAPWSTAFVSGMFGSTTGSTYGTNWVANNFERDINGDGLNDYVFVKHQNTYANGGANYTLTVDCVYLSNGSGWEKAYRCVSENPTGNTVKFYGDCAQV